MTLQQTRNPDIGQLRRAAEQGYAAAQSNLGTCYKDGTGLTQDDAEAVRWSRLAAEQGYAPAQSHLGICYGTGTGVAQDDAEAVRWSRLGAEQGYAPAQFNLGICYESGTGVAQDPAEAVRWFRLAAEQGYADARNALRRGSGLPSDSHGSRPRAGWGTRFVYGGAISTALRAGPAAAGSEAWSRFRTLSLVRKVWVAYVSLVLVFSGFLAAFLAILDGGRLLDALGTALAFFLACVGFPKLAYMLLLYMWFRLLDLVTGNRMR